MLKRHIEAHTAKGWHWYNSLLKSKKIHKKEVPNFFPAKNSTLSPAQEIKRQRALIEDLKARAILYPTIENVAQFLTVQQQLLKEATRFQQSAQLALLHYPHLNFLVTHPAENAAQPIIHRLERLKQNQILTQLANQYALFFFYKGASPLDRAYATTVKAFATQYHFSLLPISADGSLDLQLPQSKIDHGQMEQLGITVTPALILVDPSTQNIIPFHYGFASLNRLIEQALVIHRYQHRKQERNDP